MTKARILVVDDEQIARDKNISWYSICSSNYGMLHNYSTSINLEKSYWVPGSYFENMEI